ncbi:MAG: hypothetical protein BGO96_12885 [Micrococcales bacterium 73-15]|uniref:hypothetical protein n=1 Tax=Salana multivorans TaxID=120377 RepID=UPI00095DF668|nr:hypothetical protein [Salana multivorans]OJX97818.1 MAG: hypothetical protein BGO96_12885 [Micrococcales bacterium 73-15]
MTVPRAHVRPRKRRSFVPALISIVVTLAVALGALLVWQRSQQTAWNEEAVATANADLDAWESDALGLLATPPIDLAALASPADADGVAAFRAECDRIQTHAATVAAAAAPEVSLGKVPEEFPGRAEAQARRTADAEALTAYQEQVAAAAELATDFCESYPAILEVQQAQTAGVATLDGLLAECSVSDSGCVPVETDTWGQIADAVGPAYVEPAQRRAELFAAGCGEATAGVCSLVAEQSGALVPLYTAYADALRSGDRDAVESARGDLETTLTDQQTAFDQAVRDANPGVEVADPAATFASMLASDAATIDANLAAAETALLAVIG